jgi:hypothetical protein
MAGRRLGDSSLAITKLQKKLLAISEALQF